jgi:alpha-galactosidase
MPEVSAGQGPAGPALECAPRRLSVDLEQGTYSLAGEGGALSGLATGVELTDGADIDSQRTGFDFEGVSDIEDAQGRGKALALRLRTAAAEPALSLTLTLYDDQPFAAARSRLTNTTAAPLAVRAFRVVETRPLYGPGKGGAWRFYRHGWQSWSPTLALPADGPDCPRLSPVMSPATRPAEGGIVGELVGSLVHPESGRAVTLGFASTADQMSQVWLDGWGSLTAASYADGIVVAPGEGLPSERAVVDITSEPLAALERYGEALGREMGAVSWPNITSGWCSWYHYFGQVSEDDILANLERLAGQRDELPLEYVQVDDGYQAGIGDWLTTNERFPHGMAWLAERVHERGFKAGLWLAPFLAGAESELFREHPEWTVGGESGPAIALQNWGQLCHGLDCTRPEVIDWLERLFRTVCDDWGYDYVKIDFVYAAAIEGRRNDTSLTRAQAYRRGLEAIRRAVGGRFVLGCGAPIGPSIGLVNGMRISADVAPAWYPAGQARGPQSANSYSFPAAVNALRNTITRFWTHGRLWHNDPDCLLLRDSQTSLTDDEVRTLATVIGMSGGMLLDSDDLSLVPEARREMLRRLLPLRGPAALPLDLFERQMPRLLWRPDRGLLAVVNWEDAPADATLALPVEARRLTDFWTGEPVEANGRSLTLRGLPAHGSRLLAVEST